VLKNDNKIMQLHVMVFTRFCYINWQSSNNDKTGILQPHDDRKNTQNSLIYNC